MKPVVVDASVAVKWFLPEPDADAARALLSGEHRLLGPDLLWIEVVAVLWKIARRGALTAEEAQQIARDVAAFPVEIVESLPLLASAAEIAIRTDRTLYDCVYIALAAAENAVVVTADERLVNALSATPWSAHVVRLAEFAKS